jgi:4-hydroxyphenylpyruvate dioxygenase-like putative hemolysin
MASTIRQFQAKILNARCAFIAMRSDLKKSLTSAGKPDDITGLSDSSARVVMLKAGNACLELFEFATPQPKPAETARPVCDHGITHLCLQVSDIDAEYERLKKTGMEFHCPPQTVGDSLRATYGRDPDGNVVELLEVTGDNEMSIVAA